MIKTIVGVIEGIISCIESNDFIGIPIKLLALFGMFRLPYFVIGLFFTRKFKPAKVQHKYAICIAARNEETVIGNLLESIRWQDYPSHLLTVFVVADNCTDKTAAVARKYGAICYERFNDKERTKGFALQYLFERIRRDYGIETFEGYFIFDADNLLQQDYVTRMNESFDEGLKIITSYRNTKNFDDNWIAASYAIHWLRSSRKNHRARSVLRLATNIQGTGFLFSNIFVKDGWNYTSLTEDRAFTADAVARGYQISYNDAAVFYDEQPVSIKIALRQRLRWSKGHLLAFKETSWALVKNLFLGRRYADPITTPPSLGKRILESIRHRVASFDMLALLVPSSIFYTANWLIRTVLVGSILCYTVGLAKSMIYDVTSLNGNLFMDGLYMIFGRVRIEVEPGLGAVFASMGTALVLQIISRIWQYIKRISMAIYVFITERKRIIYIPWYKKVFYCLTWPMFDSIHRYTSYVALFIRVGWKPIPHKSKITIQDVQK